MLHFDAEHSGIGVIETTSYYFYVQRQDDPPYLSSKTLSRSLTSNGIRLATIPILRRRK